MSCNGSPNCECGCCAGVSVQTPQVETNRPGLPAISYRVGTWATFKESMLARLSSFDYPALTALKTRDNDDFTIAFLDATSVVLDILTFYQERLANESYLRTAGQLRSLTELARLIGYEPAPGVSASTYVAFSLKTAPGQAPDPSAPAITIPAGTQMQSVPAQGQKPQTFETSADIPAKPDWNALQVQTGLPWIPQIGDLSVYLQGTSTQLQPGDLILIVGDERLGATGQGVPTNANWDIRLITTVTADTPNNRTYIAWSEGLGFGSIKPAQQHPKIYALRQRAALFGYNAISPRLLTGDALGQITDLLTGDKKEWNFGIGNLSASSLVDLDAVYTKIVSPGWLALVMPDKQFTRTPAGFLKLYLIKSVSILTRSDFAMAAKITRLEVDSNAFLSDYYTATRKTAAFAQSEELPVTEQPLPYPLYGGAVDLRDLRVDLGDISAIAVFGKRQKLSVNSAKLSFVSDADLASTTLNPGDVLTLANPSKLPPHGSDWGNGASITLNVEDASGRPGTVTAALTDFLLVASDKNDPQVSEIALVASVNSVTDPFPHTSITLKSSLQTCYERATTIVNVNVALATQGASVSEVMGSGSAATPNQNFVLKQSPLTYIQAPTPTGRQSTLEVQVSGVKWKEVPTLFQQGASQQVFTTLNQSDGTADVVFGDGVEGSTLPTGQNNLQANYRVGSGSGGNVAAGALSTLIDRPLGVSGVTNPQPATGGQDAQSIDDVRSNAPQTVLTLGRAVSITDYQSYASTFAGISKAYAIWIPAGPGRGVFLTVAGVDGAALPPGNPTLDNLANSLHSFGNPLIPITAQSFLETLFGFSADVAYDPAYDQPTVRAQVLETLSTAYSFAKRSFGQGVSVDEIAAIIQGVPGVTAVNVIEIHTIATSAAGDLASQGGAFTVTKLNNWLAQQILLPRPFSDSPTRICPYVPVPSLTAVPLPAEILVLDPDPKAVVLGVMS